MTIIAFASINNATYGGVYYCANFTTSGAITWTKLTTTGLANTEITHFRVDYGDPTNKQFVRLSNSEIYYRNGGNWTKILDITMAAAVAGKSATNAQLKWLYTDPTTPGSVYSIFMTDPSPYDAGWCYVMKSVDYGANWAAFLFRTGRDRIKAVEAIGDNIWVSAGKQVLANSGIYYSADGGSSWNSQSATAGSTATANVRINPHEPNKCFVWGDGNAHEWTFSGGSFSSRDVGLSTSVGSTDDLWFDPEVAGRMVYLYYGADGHVYSSDDYFATVVDTSLDSNYPTGVIGPYNNAGNTGLLLGAFDPTDSAIVGYIASETDGTADERGGANTGSAPYADSVPGVVALSEYGLWWGTPAAGKGVYVYADEQGDITDIPDYDNLGAPLFGDRASWRDRKTDGFDVYHAEDVHRDERQIHAPQPTGNDGYGIIETGGYWVSSGEAIALDSDLHDAVTLDADADIILDLTGQEIGLDEQNANTVLAGPTTGAANEPTFRALVAADLGTGAPDGTKYLRDDLTWQTVSAGITVREVDTSPSISTTTLEFPNGTVTDQGGGVARYTPDTSILHEHIINEDHSSLCDGSEDTFTTALDFRIQSTAVYLNGLRQYRGTDYTEAAALDSIVFVTPPEAGDILIIDYICTYADYSSFTNLLDSENVQLWDSDGEILTDG